MASEEPLFDPSLKKKKKKVLFQEDPLGAEADPTTPAPTSLDNTTTTGEAVDLGPSTAHEQMQRAVNGGGDDAPKEDEDMFADMKKKKKKKKEIPMDFVSPTIGYDIVNCMFRFTSSKPRMRQARRRQTMMQQQHQLHRKISISQT